MSAKDDHDHDAPDAIERLLHEARPVAPAGLAARLAAGALDPALGRRLFWTDVERSARFALTRAAAVAVLALGLAAGSLAWPGTTAPAGTASAADASEVDLPAEGSPSSEPADAASLDQVARLAVSPAALEREVRALAPLAAEAADAGPGARK